MADDILFLGVFRIDGIPFTARCYTANEKNARIAMYRVMSSRNAQADTRTERMEIVRVFRIVPDNGPCPEGCISESAANQLEHDNTYRKACAAMPTVEDHDFRDTPNRIFHVPVG